MRIHNIFSITTIALLIAVIASGQLQAQSGQYQPSHSPKSQLNKFATQSQTPVQKVDHLQPKDDIQVPAILGGSKKPSSQAANSFPPNKTASPTTPPAGPAAPTVNNPKLSATPKAKAQASEVQAAQTIGTLDIPFQSDNWQQQPLRTDNAIERVAHESNAADSGITSSELVEFDSPTSAPAMETTAPQIKVETIGPRTISINKTARYEVQVTNNGDQPAKNLIVGVDFPQFIEITNSQPTVGNKEITDGTQESRMIWNLPIVEARAIEKIIIEVNPKEARAFEVDVEWTFLPIQGQTKVDVTEPKLAIQISGPSEVQFGEKALYHVTVANPGTGTAENVSVMLPEALGGERATLGNINPAEQKQFQVELIARSAGVLELTTTVSADGNLSESDSRNIMVRRAALDVQISGPGMKYAGSNAIYKLIVTNTGDAMAKDIVAAIALPSGVEYISGIENVEQIDGGIRWNVGMLSPGNERTYEINCHVNSAGDIQIEAATRGAGDLAAIDSIVTKVEAIADLVLSVHDPKGPLPIGQNTNFEITIKNRGTKAARNVKVVMQFSDGVEPINAQGLTHEIVPGQVLFTPISQIDPDQEITLTVSAKASKNGTHRFRAQLVCEESDAHEVAEGTTKFFGETTESTKTDESTKFKADQSGGQFNR